MQVHETDLELNENEQKLVRDELEKVLASERFEAAPQMSAFLRYVVEQAMAGNHSRVKAFTVAVDALGKPETFDPQNDPLVRVLAGRLRAALTAYNEEHTDSTLFITMNPGSYVPIFVKGQLIEKNLLKERNDAQRADSAAPTAHTENSIEAGSSSGHTDQNETIEAPSVSTDQSIGVDQNDRTASKEYKPAPVSSNRTPAMQKCAIAAILAFVMGLGFATFQQSKPAEPEVQSISSYNNSNSSSTFRTRPDEPVVFVSAADHINPLEISLNALVSSVVSEGGYLKVHRYFNTEQLMHSWPEDYMLNLTALDLPDETRIDMQLVQAQSGGVVHSQVLLLSPNAVDQLTREEMDTIINATRDVVAENGPLLADYSSRDIER